MRERIIPLLLVLALLLSLTAGAAGEEPAEEPEILTSGDYRYIVLADGTAEIRKYTGWDAELVIPDTLDGKAVTAIGNSAFSWCSLTAISIPDSVTSIGANPFDFCDRLTKIIVSPDHPALATIDGVLFSKPDKRLVCYPCAFTAEEYVIPQGITSIGEEAFYWCTSLTGVTIPDGVTAIGDSAFSNCRSLTSVTIPDSVTSVGGWAFSGCRSLTSVTIPDSVTAIGEAAFYGCDSLTLTVTRGSYAWLYCKDNNLTYTYPDALDWLNN